jgi:uncharacterized RDD family membrane protein YckC
MNYDNLDTPKTYKRIIVIILNSITPIAISVMAILQSKLQPPIILNWFFVTAILIYMIVNHLILVKLYGGSLFHILFHLRVVTSSGDHGISWLQAMKRFLATSVLGLFAHLLPYAPIFLNGERKHLGDLWAGTRLIDLKTRRSESPKFPRHMLFILLLVIGVAGMIGQLKSYSSYKINSQGLVLELPELNGISIPGLNPSLWTSDTKNAFISHCSTISFEYLKIAMQGQGVDDTLMTKFEQSIKDLCTCVSREVENSAISAKVGAAAIQQREQFEVLFEDEEFTAAYVQASSACEQKLKQ